MTKVEKAIEIAIKGHKDQKDKSGLPYILHPLRVMLKMHLEEEMIPAVLHDILEDTSIDENQLLAAEIPKESIAIVKLLTKNKGDDYLEYIQRIKKDRVAAKIKLADITDNIDIMRLPKIDNEDIARFNHYLKALKILSEE